ncbi:pyridoxamine 5'-phosphate oxidase family protein [Parvularcula mediterranea]|uniref:pyridoxamine 5'-phosphate oxidase family protein n=1 Tax=Parvularcula mediterranea TaxID=2732508 RepID=UPI0015654569|nr:pyridoxamine 5'-phosphate oxidase family protein [Parvularcula mediterranea]
MPKFILDQLGRGSADAKSPFHWPTLGTSDPHGAPRMRTVVLRRLIREERQLIIYTDRRAKKVAELEANAAAAIHVYDTRHRTQLRLAGVAETLTDGPLHDEAVKRTGQAQAADFVRSPAPGTAIDVKDGFDQNPDDLRENLAVILFTFHRAELLHLGGEAPRRALVKFSVEPPEPTWLVP